MRGKKKIFVQQKQSLFLILNLKNASINIRFIGSNKTYTDLSPKKKRKKKKKQIIKRT